MDIPLAQQRRLPTRRWDRHAGGRTRQAVHGCLL